MAFFVVVNTPRALPLNHNPRRSAMPTIDDFEIPPPLLSEFAAIVDQAKAQPLLALAKMVPALGRGLRPTAVNVKFVRQRLAACLVEPGSLAGEVRDFLAQEGLNGELVLVLSEAALKACFTEFLAIYGQERLLAALLLDRRLEVRQLAVAYCQSGDWQRQRLPDRQRALSTTAETLRPFLAAIAVIRDDSSVVSIRADEEDGSRSAEIAGLRRKIAGLEERVRQARDEKKSDKRVDLRVEALKKQAVELEDKLGRERQNRQTAEAALSEAKAHLQGLGAAQDDAVRAGVQAEMQSVLRQWLVEPQRLAKAVGELTAKARGDILERAKAALASQGERDRHFGNRRLLRHRLHDLRQAEASLLQAASEAISPLPDLAALLPEIQREAVRIETLLDEARSASPLAQRLTGLIRQAGDQGDLERARRLLQDLEAAGCLTPAETRILYQEYHACLGRLFDRFAPRPLPIGKDSDPALSLDYGIATMGKGLWLLDGYNILFGLPDIFADSYEAGRPAAQARTRLLTMIQVLLAGTGTLADVFFDGEASGQENFSPQVKVVYSGGGGAGVRNRADQAIVASLESQPPGAAVPCVVVTDDRELAGRCQGVGARVMPLRQFADLLYSALPGAGKT